MKEMKTKPDQRKEERFKREDKVWVKKGIEVFPVLIETGITDGTNIEVKKGLKPDDVVILSMSSSVSNGAQKNATTNPFMPKPPSRKK